MKKTVPALLLALTACVSLPAAAQQKAKEKPAAAAPAGAAENTVATVNGKAIPFSRMDFMIRSQLAQGVPDSEQMRAALRDELIGRELMYQSAVTKGIDKNPNVLTQLDITRQTIVIRNYLEDFIRAHPITEDAIKGEYDRLKSQLGDKEYKARHILLKDEAKAKEVIAKLQAAGKPEDLLKRFEELAKDSEDQASKNNGGALEWTTQAQYAKSFSDAMVKLQKGKFTPQPVKTEYGFHVIMLDDVRDFTPPALDQVKQRISQSLEQQAVAAHVRDLRQKASIK